MRLVTAFAAATLVCGLVCTSATRASADDKPLYAVSKTVAVGSPDRWDLLSFDPASRRLFLAHGTEVTVIDGDTGAVIGNIGDFPGGTHGVAIVPETGRGYTDEGKSAVADSFDLKTLKVEKHTPAAADADAIAYDPKSGHVFVINGDTGSITVIDPKADSAMTTINVGGGLEIGAADGAGKLYVAGADKQELVRIDTATNTVDARWPIPTCTSPHGLALDPESRRVFVSCVNKVMLSVDADSGKVVATQPIGAFTDSAGFDPLRKRVFSSNGEGSLSVFDEKDPNTLAPLATVSTVPSARTMAVDPKTGRVYLAAITITKVDPPTTPGGRPHFEFAPGSLRVLFLDPQ